MTPPIGSARAGLVSQVDAIPDSGVSRWTFDDADTSGSTATDVWGPNDGTINGATTGASGANQTYLTNEAYEFDGSNDNVDTGITSLPTPFSWAFWVNIDAFKGDDLMGIFNSTSEDFYIQTGTKGTTEIEIVDDSVGNVSTIQLSADNWYHIVGIRSDDALIIYLDGSQEDSNTGNSAQTFAPGNSWLIGAVPTLSNFDGSIDDVRYYDKELSSTEVSNLYNTGSIS